MAARRRRSRNKRLHRPSAVERKLQRAYALQLKRIRALTDLSRLPPPELELTEQILRLVVGAFQDLDRLLRNDFSRIVPATVDAVELVGQAALNQAIRTNVSLIKTYPSVVRADLQETLAANRGLAPESLGKLINERFGVARSRADFWARDQTRKTHAHVARQRAEAAGLNRYRWRTSQDERVRESHAELDGQVFTWADPPTVGHPGEDYDCRCTAEFLFEDEI